MHDQDPDLDQHVDRIENIAIGLGWAGFLLILAKECLA